MRFSGKIYTPALVGTNLVCVKEKQDSVYTLSKPLKHANKVVASVSTLLLSATIKHRDIYYAKYYSQGEGEWPRTGRKNVDLGKNKKVEENCKKNGKEFRTRGGGKGLFKGLLI